MLGFIKMNVAELPKEVQEYISSLESKNKQLTAETEKLELKYNQVYERLQLELYNKYGRSVDWVDPAQIQLFFTEKSEKPEAEETKVFSDATTVKSYNRKNPGRKAIHDSVPREKFVIDIPEEEKTCACGCELTKIGEEVSEKLEIIPPRIYAKQTIRPKYACRNCEGSGDEDKPAVRIAPVPPSIIPQGIATPSLLASIFVDKYVDHLPFYRQEARFARIGVNLSRQNMCNWVNKVFIAVTPLLDLMKAHLKSGKIMQMDETTLQVLNEEGKTNVQKSYMWLARGGPADKPVLIYEYYPTRGARHIYGFIDGFKGYLQTDGYEGYCTALKDHPEIIHVGCMAHARRKFVEAAKVSKKTGSAEQAVAFIKKLYRIEQVLREKKLSDEEFLSQRKEQSQPILDKFKAWLEKKREQIPASLKMGTAINYTLKQWSRLIQYLECAELTPDNNASERDIKPFVIGRKNWYFSASPSGADASCGIYSLIETAKANGLNPYDYLRYLFEMAPHVKSIEDWEALLPWNSKEKLQK